MPELDLEVLVEEAIQQPRPEGAGDFFLKLPMETARGLLDELKRHRSQAVREMQFAKLLIAANGSKQRRIEQLRADLKRMARATSVAGAQSMARHALTQDVARRRRFTVQELKMLPQAPPAKPAAAEVA